MPTSITDPQTAGHRHYSEEWLVHRSYKIGLTYLESQHSTNEAMTERSKTDCTKKHGLWVLKPLSYLILLEQFFELEDTWQILKPHFTKPGLVKIHGYGIIYVNKRKILFSAWNIEVPIFEKASWSRLWPGQAKNNYILACFSRLSLDIKFNLCRSNF